MKPNQTAVAQRHTGTKQRNASIIKCRLLGLGDATIAHVFNVSRQHIHKIAGPRPEAPPVKPDPPRFGAQGTEPDLPVTLRLWRRKHNWSQTEAAAELGISVTTLSRWESGRNECSFSYLVARFIDLYENGSVDTVRLPAQIQPTETKSVQKIKQKNRQPEPIRELTSHV